MTARSIPPARSGDAGTSAATGAALAPATTAGSQSGPGRQAQGPSVFQVGPGAIVRHKGRRYTILHVLSFHTLVARDEVSGETTRLPIAEVGPPDEPPAPGAPATGDGAGAIDLMGVSEAHWAEAQRRYAAINHLLDPKERTDAAVHAAAEQAGVHWTTIYRWLAAFDPSGRVSALVPGHSSGGRGRSRLPPETERVLHEVINEYFLTTQKPPVQEACNEVLRVCEAAGVAPPHPNTVRNRIALITAERKTAAREGGRQADDAHGPHPGSLPGADWPGAVVQIDHTKVDLMLVDDVERRPIGCPWLTLLMDVFCRMVLGFYLSFDPPSTMSLALCIAQAVLPKDRWLARRGLALDWPCYGKFGTIRADNAKEFRGNAATRACEEHRMILEWRAVTKPRYGAHIERLLGTLMRATHLIPGTTFSNPAQRGNYDSTARAVMTVSEYEAWFATYVNQVYHKRFHRGIGMAPARRYHEGIFGMPQRPGTGLPDRIVDEERFLLDFTPYFERTVQDDGVVIDHMRYYDEVLRPYVNAPDPDHPGRKRKFRFHRDPRDVSLVHKFDPERGAYAPIPTRDLAAPAMSVWEWHEAEREARREARGAIDDAAILAAYTRLREMAAESERKTVKARRAGQRRRMHEAAREERRDSARAADSAGLTADDYPADEHQTEDAAGNGGADGDAGRGTRGRAGSPRALDGTSDRAAGRVSSGRTPAGRPSRESASVAAFDDLELRPGHST